MTLECRAPEHDEARLEPVSWQDAGRAWLDARDLVTEHRYLEALLKLDLVRARAVRITDRMALLEAEALLGAGQTRAACTAFGQASESPHSDVSARARVGLVRCGLRSGAPASVRAFAQLEEQFPALPDATALSLELADALYARGDVATAIARYRAIDLRDPSSREAVVARERLAHARSAHHTIPPYTELEEVDRAERFSRGAPAVLAREHLEQLLVRITDPVLRRRLAVSGERIARNLGDNQVLLAFQSVRLASEMPSSDLTVASAEARATEHAVRRILGRRGWARIKPNEFDAAVRATVLAKDTDQLTAAVTALVERELPAEVRFDAATLMMGAGVDVALVAVFEKLAADSNYEVPSRYYLARLAEAQGRLEVARAGYETVVRSDRSDTRFYALWAKMRLAAAAESTVAESAAVDAGVPRATTSGERTPQAGVARLKESDPTLSQEAARAHVATLTRLEARYGEAFPWIARARELIELGDKRAAADELHEVYIAWRKASRRPVHNTGLEAVFRNGPRRAVSTKRPLTRARVALASDAAQALGEISASLGDYGTAINLGKTHYLRERPRAYETVVERVAAKHGIDPNLLYAVMRVESVYQSRVVSYAGAVGLMQIMPRTGASIAEQLERTRFRTDDLLDPELNLEFSAWYLRSLLDRFDGSLPLAIAAYNGGPQNVRRWLQGMNPDMPLEAFLEHVPFGQTHRYVRRVLSHYVAYRAQSGLPVPAISDRLPAARPDRVAF